MAEQQQQTKHATGHGVALSESLTTEDIMKRNARRHLVQDVSKKLNDALDMYHARQEEQQDAVHIGEAASSRAAGAAGAHYEYHPHIHENHERISGKSLRFCSTWRPN